MHSGRRGVDHEVESAGRNRRRLDTRGGSESGEAPGTLREQVTSPNGTTAAALAVLMGDNRLKTLMEEAVEAARARSVELGS